MGSDVEVSMPQEFLSHFRILAVCIQQRPECVPERMVYDPLHHFRGCNGCFRVGSIGNRATKASLIRLLTT